MKRVFKIIKWGLGITLFIMILGSALLLVYKDKIKGYALEEINQYLNKKVHVSSIDVSLWKTFPNLTLRFDDVLVYSKFKDFQTADTALYAQSIDLQFSILDFYHKNYNIQRINITNAKLHLKVREDGSINYDFLKTQKDSVQSPFSFELNKIALYSTDFSYTNEATNQHYTGFFKTLKFTGQFNEQQFIMNAQTQFDIHKIQSKSLTLIQNQSASCKISIQMNQDQHIFQIKSADLKINHLPFFIKGKISKDSLNLYINAKDLDLVEVAKNFSFQKLQMIKEVKGRGKVNFELTIKGDRNKTTAPAINANFQVRNGSLLTKGFSLSQIRVIGEYSNGISTPKEYLKLSSVQFHTLQEDFTGTFLITDFEQPRIRGQADGVLDLEAFYYLFGPFGMQKLNGSIQLHGTFDIQLRNLKTGIKGLSIHNLKASFNLHAIVVQFKNDQRQFKIARGHITFRNQLAGIKDLHISLGKSNMTLSGELRHIADYFNAEKDLFVHASLKSEYLDIDQFFDKREAEASSKHWILPEKIEGSILLDLNKVRYSGHNYSHVKTKMVFKKHQLNFPYLSGINAEAKIKGKLKIIEERPMFLWVQTSLQSKSVRFQPLFKEWNNFHQKVITSKNIQGRAAIQLQFKGPFDLFNHQILMDKFDVRAHIKITDGALINVESFKNITESLRSSAAHLLISKATMTNFERHLLHLKFDTFENTLTIKDGVISIPKMTIHSNALDLTAKGTQTFDNKINYYFNFRFRDIKEEKKSTFGDVIDDGSGFRIFLKMTGTLQNPIFSWDKKAKENYQKERNEEAKEELKSALKTGFGIRKKDTSIQLLKKSKYHEDRVIMNFNKDSIPSEFQPQEEEKEKTRLQKKIEQWKKKNKEEEPQFTIELGE